MFFTYVLKNLSHDTFYVGSSENPEERLGQHNKGKVRYTKGRIPWKLVYKEEFITRSDAVRREKFLKSGRGREYVKKISGA